MRCCPMKTFPAVLSFSFLVATLSGAETRTEIVRATIAAVTLGVLADGADLKRLDDKTYR